MAGPTIAPLTLAPPTLAPMIAATVAPIGASTNAGYSYLDICSNLELKRQAAEGTLSRDQFDGTAIQSNLHETLQQHLHDIMPAVLGLVCVALVILAFQQFDRRWKKRNERAYKVSATTTDAMEYAKRLVQLFMPSWKLEKYQFRGMRRSQRKVAIGFNELSLTLNNNGKQVLKGVTGSFEAGRMCAIMGPSGAGKTTFANVLCGKATYGIMGGTVEINGIPASIRNIKSVTGFVPQDDIVHESLTVREQIFFSARLRNKVDTSAKRIGGITEDVLNVMQIHEIQNSIVGGVVKRGISGGQRKRVNIGLELASNPTVLFLDEPTSGLDSSSSLAVVASLKKMCELGMTSIMVIHQPRFSLFTLFDDVLLLGKGGQTVYLGPSTGAKPYFESLGFTMPSDENPADWFMDILSGELRKNQGQPDGFKPSQLFQWWIDKKDDTMVVSSRLSRAGTMASVDHTLCLKSALQDEWHLMDMSGDGRLQHGELKTLLGRCCQSEPSDEVLEEMMMRMAGDADAGVTKDQFVEYLTSLRGLVASDQYTEVMAAEEQRMHQIVTQVDHLLQADRARSIMSRVRARTRIFSDVDRVDSSDESSSENELSSASETDEALDVESGRKELKALNRRTPGFPWQCAILTRRQIVAWWRQGSERCLFLAALSAGAIVLGCMDAFVTRTPSWQVMSILNVHTALSLLLAIFTLGLFGSDRTVFWRESATGLSVGAHFISRVLVNVVDILIFSFVFCAIFYCIVTPEMAFNLFYFPYVLVAFVSSGWGYFVSTVVPPEHGSFIVSLIVFVSCGLLGSPANLPQFLASGPLMYAVNMTSITRWSVQLSFMLNVYEDKPIPEGETHTPLYCLGMGTYGSSQTWLSDAVWALSIQGCVLHVVALLGLKFMHRDKQV